MHKITYYFLRSLSYLTISTLLIGSFLFAFFQTPYAQKKITEYIENYAKENHLNLKLTHLKGRPPLFFHLSALEIEDPTLGKANLENIHLHIALLPLFQGRLVISSLDVEKAFIQIKNIDLKKESSEELSVEDIKKLLRSFKQICFHNLNIEKDGKTYHSYYVLAGSKFKKKLESIDLKVTHLDTRSSFQIFGHYYPLKCLLEAQAFIDLKDSSSLLPFIDISTPFATKTSAIITGPVNFQEDHLLYLLNTEINSDFRLLGSQNTPFLEKPFEISSTLILSNDKCHVKNLNIVNEDLAIETNGNYYFKDKDFDYIAKASLINVKDIMSTSLVDGKAHISAKGSSTYHHLQLFSETLSLNDQEISPLTIDMSIREMDNGWEGVIDGLGEESSFPLKIFGKLKTDHFRNIELDNFVINTDAAQFSAQATLSFSPFSIHGASYLNIYKLSSFSDIFEGAAVEGKLGITTCFVEEKNATSAQLQIHAEGLRYNDTYVSLIDGQGIIDNFTTDPTGSFTLNLSNLSSSSYYVDSFKLDASSKKEGSWPFTVNALGNWKSPFDLTAEGTLSYTKDKTAFELSRFQGMALKQTFTMKDPIFFEKDPTHTCLSPLHITTTSGELSFSFELAKEHSHIDLDMVHMPLEILAISHPDFSLSGSTSLSLHTKSLGDDLTGNFRLAIEEVDYTKTASKSTKLAKGIVEAHLASHHIQAFAELHADDNQKMSLQGTIPYDFKNDPFTFSINTNKSIYSKLSLKGKIEELFDFVDLGANRITGHLETDLLLSGVLEDPVIQGHIKLENGTYESYLMGSYLKDISLDVEAAKGVAFVNSCIAYDEKGGYTKAKGKWELSKARKFPFDFNFELYNLSYLNLDTLKASFTGPLNLSGDMGGIKIKCNVEVPEASYMIADIAAPALPTLEVEYVHQPKKVQRSFSKKQSLPFKVDLDAEVDAPAKVFVSGKGLNSEWGGHLNVKTLNNDITLAGTLSLVKGEYLFSGKRFTLQEGQILFTPNSDAYVNLKGNTEIAGYSIAVQVRGSLDEPTLTFTSMPNLPTSSILSFILFNKDISEITPFQAIQLAQTLVSLSSGSGPDILDKIRTSLGVDRFGIVSDTRGGDQVSLQIGKYLTQGVLVTLSQSTTSSDVIVEVDLKHGFVFQAETQDQQEGKFSLKWHHNY